MEKLCIVVGGGPSITDFDFNILKDQDTIVVNQAIFQVPHANHFLTMDYTWLLKSRISVESELRNWFFHHSAEKYFVLALGEDRLKRIDANHYIDKKFNLHYNLSLFPNIIRPICYGGMGKTIQDFHYGSDSGFSALQLAVVLGYKKIYLLGFDFCNQGSATHYHNDYPPIFSPEGYQTKLDEFLIPYPEAFRQLRDMGIQVFSSSHISKLNKYILYIDLRKIL